LSVTEALACHGKWTMNSGDPFRSNVLGFRKPELEAGDDKRCLYRRNKRLGSWNDQVEEVLQALREARGERWWE
jgi:hypothetical protein